MFDKIERGGFKYTFAHWCAYQMTALNLGVWKFKYLFHDFEKPWLMLLWRDYSRVQKWHRKHNRHHLEYAGGKGYDYEAMILDWECSKFTKLASPLTARETYEGKFMNSVFLPTWAKHGIESALIKLNL